MKHRRSHGLQLVSLLLGLAGAGCAAEPDKSQPTGDTGGDSSGSSSSSGSAGSTGTKTPVVDLVNVPARHNYFADRGHSDDETKKKIDEAWQSLFAGDPDNEAVYFTAGSNENGDLAYILDYGNNDVRSEGMSYGMMIALQTGHKAEFDALWNWAVTYMYHADPAHPAHGYFAWQLKPDGKQMDPMPAADGEEYFAAALLFADARWGSGTGIYDYKARARQLLTDLVHREEIAGSTVKGSRTANALFNATEFKVRFSPDLGCQRSDGDFTDPSYHLPAFYEVFARVGPEEDSEFWSKAAEQSRAFFVKAAHPTTGLTPDYANFDGSPKAASWDKTTGNFRYDAFRSVMNWSMDYAWNEKFEDAVTLSNRLLNWFGPDRALQPGAVYTLDGTPQVTTNSVALLSCNAVAALAADADVAAPFIDALWRIMPPMSKWRYYDGMLYFLSLLHVSGQFRDWTAP